MDIDILLSLTAFPQTEPLLQCNVLVIMPKWIPAKIDGQNIKSRVTIPVTFKVAE